MPADKKCGYVRICIISVLIGHSVPVRTQKIPLNLYRDNAKLLILLSLEKLCCFQKMIILNSRNTFYILIN